jgi:hypothetical protein
MAFALVIFIAVIICSPFAILEGLAKAKYLKETKGLEFAWYEAAFLDIDIKMSENDVDLNTNLSFNKDKK